MDSFFVQEISFAIPFSMVLINWKFAQSTNFIRSKQKNIIDHAMDGIKLNCYDLHILIILCS
jgi:hypothetical protein